MIQSTRRMFFTHCSVPMDSSSGNPYHADIVYSLGGTGLLIKKYNIFFILTAKHVISANYSEQQNESPFYVELFNKITPEIISPQNRLYTIGFPIRGWNIGELLGHHHSTHVDFDDLLLVELSSVYTSPDRYVDLDNSRSLKLSLSREDFWPGLYLLASGFPINQNEIIPNEGHGPSEYNYAATSNRHTYPGICVEDGFDGFKMQLTGGQSHSETNGMSGGIVTTFSEKANKTKLAGVIQRAGNGYISFCPSYEIFNAIGRFRDASSFSIDPASHLSDINNLITNDGIEARGEIMKSFIF